MEPINEQEYTKLLKAFSAAHNKKEEYEHDSMWQTRLMGHIRSMESIYAKAGYMEIFQRFVWRLAPLSCVLALVLGIVIMQTDFTSEYELAKMFVEDPVDYSFLGLYDS